MKRIDPTMLKVLWATSVALLAGCSAQAGHDYKGEPLLSMHGTATIAALTAGESVVPALCFFGDYLHHPAAIDWSALPAEVSADFAPAEPNGPPLDALYFTQDRLTHIVDVESHGAFPAQFDVDVYLPPPDAALQSMFAGEPRQALGRVCAAVSGHGAVTHRVQRFESWGPQCEGPNDTGACKKRFVWLVPGTTRFYTESYRCPAADSDIAACTKTAQGDASLQFEYWAEQVVGASDDVSVVYLAEPAPAGSYTAWGLGSPSGVAAGYHLYRAFDDASAAFWDSCDQFGISQTAMQELSQQYPQLDLGMYPLKRMIESFNDAYLPDDVIAAGERITARITMAQCPSAPPSTAVDAQTHSLSIQINQRDPIPPPISH